MRKSKAKKPVKTSKAKPIKKEITRKIKAVKPRADKSKKPSEVSKRMTEARESQGLSIIEVADAMGIKTQNLYEFESGKREPTLEILRKYAKAIKSKLIVDFLPEAKKKPKKKGTYVVTTEGAPGEQAVLTRQKNVKKTTSE